MMIPSRPQRLLVTWTFAALAAAASTAHAQSSDDTRPATATAGGDTGLWYVPTAEVLAHGRWSASGYRTGSNYVEGFSNVVDVPLTFAAGISGRVEVFGAFKAVTRIDRDLRPLFTSNETVGGVVPRYPFVRQGWTGNMAGDFLAGIKLNLLSEHRERGAAVALRGSIKLPTGNKESGASTGKVDSFVDVIVSKDVLSLVEIAGYGGAALRQSPEEATQSNSFRWGIGAGFPSRSPLRLTTELTGERAFDERVTLSKSIVAADGSSASGSSPLNNQNAATVGVTWQQRSGFFVGAGLSWSLPTEGRSAFRTDSQDAFGDFVDYQVRIGYHPGTRPRFTPAPPPPPPPPAAPAPPPPPPPNRPPTFGQGGPGAQGTASSGGGIQVTGPNGAPCNPCTVEPGQSVTLSAPAQDPDGDVLTFKWTAPVGTFSNPASPTTQWTAPQGFEGPVQLTVTADDGKGGTTSSTVTVNVARPAPVAELNFEDVYFDFDRSTLRTEALRLLDNAVAALQANPGKNIIIEGHTCNIGTAEYNLALGERRARSVMNYLTSRGVAASRLELVSYGEERPKYDNAREETRRLNRRSALVVKVQ